MPDFYVGEAYIGEAELGSPATYILGTLGKITPGTQSAQINKWWSCKFTAPQDGEIIDLNFYGNLAGPGNYKLCIWSDNGGAPDALLAQSASATINTTIKWWTRPISYSFSASEVLHFGFIADDWPCEIYRDAGGTSQFTEFTENSANWSTPPDPPTVDGQYDYEISIYANFIFQNGAALTLDLSDGISFTDSVLSKDAGKALADTVNLADANAKDVSIVKADTISLADLISKEPNKVLADGITLTDAETEELFFNLNLGDNITFSDSNINDVSKSIADNIGLVDANTKDVGKSLSDGISFTDQITKQVEKLLSDNITFSDNLSTAGAFNLSLNDSITLTDSISKQVDKSLADSIAFADLISKQTGVNLSDGIVLNDSLTKDFSKILADIINLADVATPQGSLTLSLSDSITFTDGLTLYSSVALIKPEYNIDYSFVKEAHTINYEFNKESHTIDYIFIKTPIGVNYLFLKVPHSINYIFVKTNIVVSNN